MNEQYIMIPASEFLNQISDIVSKSVSDAVNTATKKNDDERLISAKEACELFQPAISRPTLLSWAKQGRIHPRHTGGKRVFYLKSEILEAAKVTKKYGR